MRAHVLSAGTRAGRDHVGRADAQDVLTCEGGDTWRVGTLGG